MTPFTRWSTDAKTHNLCTNMHTHTHTHVYKRIDVQIHIHMHIYTYIMSAHIHKYTYIHTHIGDHHWSSHWFSNKQHYLSHTHTKCTYERTQSTSETTARQRLRGQPNLTPRSSALLPIRITTARRPDHIRLSALVQSRSTQFIVHASSQLGHDPPKWGHFSAILAWLVNLENFPVLDNRHRETGSICMILYHLYVWYHTILYHTYRSRDRKSVV